MFRLGSYRARIFGVLLIVAAAVVPAPQSRAEDPTFEQIDTPRFILRLDKNAFRRDSATSNPSTISSRALQILDETAEELQRLFGKAPTGKVVLRFLSPTVFRRETNAPDWTTGMFWHGEIVVPVSREAPVYDEELKRTLRHEYLHAVVAELSNFRCPAWIDEGLAQLVEGRPPASLSSAMRKWTAKNKSIIPLPELERGFTSLPDRMVPAAYAESYYAAERLISEQGYTRIASYLALLGAGKDEDDAFYRAFGFTLDEFERGFQAAMRQMERAE